MAEPYPKPEPLEPEELEARRLDAALGRFWEELVRLPSRQKTPGRQYVTALLDEDPHWTTNDRDFEHAATWTPNVFLAGLDDENVVEIPALFVVLQTDGDAIPVSEQARARLEELGLPAPHYELADPTTLTLLWRIQPFHRPKKADLRPDQVAAWNNGKLWWQVAMAKLELAFLELRALPSSFTRRLSLPHPSPRSRYLENGAHLLDAAPELPTLRVVDISKPLNAFDAEAWKRVRPHDPRPPLFLLGKNAWLGSKRFLEAKEPKRQGERHAAALTQACCYRWAGYDRQAILSELRAWAETNLDTRGFPHTRARSDEINDLVEWALRRLVPGGPTQREAPVRGHYTKREAALACVLAFLQDNAGEWLGTISDLANAATLHAAQSAQGEVAGLKVAVTKDSLKKLLPELRHEHGVLTVVERSGETWTTRWRLARPVATAPKPPQSTNEQASAPRPESQVEAQTGKPRCQSVMSIGPLAPPPAPVLGSGSDLCVRDPNQEGGSGGRALPPDDPSPAPTLRISDTPHSGILRGPVAVSKPASLAVGSPVPAELEARVRGLCALGLSLTLLKPGSKEPVRDRWTPAQHHRTSPERLLQALFAQPDANLAIVCGEISNIVVVDLDSADAVTWARRSLPETPIRTRTARGEHWFFRWPGPVKNQRRLRGADADIKADGGYVVAPGSLHPMGSSTRRSEPGLPTCSRGFRPSIAPGSTMQARMRSSATTCSARSRRRSAPGHRPCARSSTVAGRTACMSRTPVAAANGMATSVSVIPGQLASGLLDWNISNPVDQNTKTPLSVVLNRLAERGYAQRDLERVLGLSPGYLSKLRHEKVTPSFQLDALLRLVDEAPKSTLASIARLAGLTPPRPARPEPPATARRRGSAPSVKAPRSAALLVSLAPLFAKHQVRWALTGARALGAYGLHRSTVDVDILVHTDDRHALAIMRELGHEIGFFSDEHVFCFPSRRKDPNDKLDIHFPRLPPLTAAVLHPELRSVFGAKLPVVAPLPLAAWKLMSTTAKDQADAAALISCGFVSRAAVAELLRGLLAGPKPHDPYARRQFAPERALAALEID